MNSFHWGELVLARNWMRHFTSFFFPSFFFLRSLRRTTTCYPPPVSRGASGCVFAWTSELISAFFRRGGRLGSSIYSSIHKLHLWGCRVWEPAFPTCFWGEFKVIERRRGFVLPFIARRRLKGVKSITMTRSVICENKCRRVFAIINT